MTVTYSLDVSTSRISTFLKVLFRWRGSVYKALWKETIMFLIFYFALNFLYKYGLNSEQKELFERIAAYCRKYSDLIPLSFILGFYVTIVFNRWWMQFQTIAWPDTVALFVASYCAGKDERGRLLRRTIVRYINLAFVLGLRLVSSAVKKRFPTMEHIVEAGYLTPAELKAYEDVPTRFIKPWVPCQWACTLLVRARRENRINNDWALIECIRAVNGIRINVRDMNFFDWMSIPLVYTQVVTLAVYAFFVACLMGRQHLEGQGAHLYFPVFTTLQFIFYVGWLKVAECMINPFGEDDDDFEVNFMIERNIQCSYLYVDENYDLLPPLQHDIFWDTTDVQIPHTAASYGIKSAEFEGSTAEIKIPQAQTELVVAEPIPEGDETESQQGATTQGEQPKLFRKITSALMGINLGHVASSSSLVDKARRKVSTQSVSTWSQKSGAGGGENGDLPRDWPTSVSRQIQNENPNSTFGGKLTHPQLRSVSELGRSPTLVSRQKSSEPTVKTSSCVHWCVDRETEVQKPEKIYQDGENLECSMIDERKNDDSQTQHLATISEDSSSASIHDSNCSWNPENNIRGSIGYTTSSRAPSSPTEIVILPMRLRTIPEAVRISRAPETKSSTKLSQAFQNQAYQRDDD